jgi:hypothetical protein
MILKIEIEVILETSGALDGIRGALSTRVRGIPVRGQTPIGQLFDGIEAIQVERFEPLVIPFAVESLGPFPSVGFAVVEGRHRPI